MDGAKQELLLMGSCTFDPRSLTLRDAAGSTLHLKTQSMRVLAELARTRGAIVPRDVLIEAVWHGVAVTDDSLVQCIKDIRGALSDIDHTVLRTVVGQGYVISARTVSDDGDAPPRVCIERFKVAGTAPEAEELAEAVFEDLMMRLAPRAGITVVTDPSRRMDASYVISGRVSTRGGKTRIFAQIARSGRGGGYPCHDRGGRGPRHLAPSHPRRRQDRLGIAGTDDRGPRLDASRTRRRRSFRTGTHVKGRLALLPLPAGELACGARLS